MNFGENLLALRKARKISQDELVRGRKPKPEVESDPSDTKNQENEKTTKKLLLFVLKIVAGIIGTFMLADIIVMVIYFITNGFPSI